MDTWDIVYIPDKPSISADQQPTVDVYAAVIEPKHANFLIRRFNQIAPLENLRHVKRVQKIFLKEGEIELSLILYQACDCDYRLGSIPQDVKELVSSYQYANMLQHQKKSGKNNVSYGQHLFIPRLSKIRVPFSFQVFLFFLSNFRLNIDGITGFSEEDSQSIISFMKLAVQLSKSTGHSVVNAAVIVDPSGKQVIATACDQTCSWNCASDKVILRSSKSELPERFASHADSSGVLRSCSTQHINGLTDESKQLYFGVSCLYPWLWTEQQSNMMCNWHPLRHASMVAIESSAARDRTLFPNMVDTRNKCNDMDGIQSSSVSSLPKRQKTDSAHIKGNENLDACSEGSHSLSTRPYLCTGYDIYLVWEPCAMCAMALVHQRLRRIFFAFPNPNAGALGSVYRLQGEKSLNHHYAVFRVLVPEEVLGRAETGRV